MKVEGNLYHYKASVKRVIDGDTFVASDIDLGFNIFLKDQRVRILGVDTMELRDKDEAKKILAFEAKDFAVDMIEGKEVVIRSIEFDNFGRILADVWIDGVSIGDTLIEKGLAEVYKR